MASDSSWYDATWAYFHLRSFSSLWYWIGLAVLWSSVSHFVIGVPFDLVIRARRRGGEAERDVDALAHIHARRMLAIFDTRGAWIVGVVAFWLTVFGLLGFRSDIEFAQALFVMLAPLVPVGFLTVRAARGIERDALTGEALRRKIGRTRLAIQAIGFLALLLAGMWGMYQNFLEGPLRG